MIKQTVLVVDDDHEVVRLMRAYLEQAGYEVLVAYNGETAVHSLRREKPDLLLLDWMLPDRDGIDIVRIVRADQGLRHIPIIMLTARVDDTDKIVGLEIGADDYVTKPYNPREVVARVKARLRVYDDLGGQTQHLEVGGILIDVGAREVLVDDRPLSLTATEFNLLLVLMQQPGYVFSRSELISKGLGEDYEGLDRTLDSHIRNLRQKVEENPKQPIYIQTVYGVGYRLIDGRSSK